MQPNDDIKTVFSLKEYKDIKEKLLVFKNDKNGQHVFETVSIQMKSLQKWIRTVTTFFMINIAFLMRIINIFKTM